MSYISSLPADHPNAVLVDDYVHDLRTAAVDIEKARGAGDAKFCWTKSADIKGVAASMGFEAIGEIAEATMKVPTASSSIEEPAPELKRLAEACKRAQARKAA